MQQLRSRLWLCLMLAAFGCGGTGSETPFPVEPTAPPPVVEEQTSPQPSPAGSEQPAGDPTIGDEPQQ